MEKTVSRHKFIVLFVVASTLLFMFTNTYMSHMKLEAKLLEARDKVHHESENYRFGLQQIASLESQLSESFSEARDNLQQIASLESQLNESLSEARDNVQHIASLESKIYKSLAQHQEDTVALEASKKTPQFNAISEQEVTSYRRLIRVVSELLTSNNITYWVVGGTHIGVVRCSPPGMARWDDDMDIGILGSDMTKVNFLLLNHTDLVKYDYPWHFSQVRLKDWDREIHRKNYALDIFPYIWLNESVAPHEAGYYMGHEGEFIGIWKDSVYQQEDIDQVHDCPFWDLILKCPGNPMDHGKALLQREFGDDVTEQARMWSHDLGNDYQNVDLVNGNLNQHSLYWPAMDRELLEKIKFRMQ